MVDLASQPITESLAAKTATASDTPAPRYRLADLCWTACGRNRRFHYIARDDAADRYLRLGPEEYQLACCFVGGSDIVTAFKLWLRQRPDQTASAAKGQKILQFLISRQILLPIGTTLSADAPPATPNAVLPQVDPLSFRLPIVSGDILRRALEPLLRFKSLNRGVVWLAALAAAFVAYLLASTAILEQSRQLLLSHSKLYWLWAWLLLKIVHEAGHAAVALASGSAVGGAGVTFFCFAPIPYVDVSDIWRSGRRRIRLLCSAAGVMAEAIVAAAAGLIWLLCDHPMINYFCCATVMLGTVTTLTFNANPLMRYDGYYFFSDLIDQPDLWQRSSHALRTRATYLLGYGNAITGNLLHAAYGLATLAYRMLLLGSLAIGAISVWHGVGVILALFGGYRWLVVPAWLAVKRRRLERALAPQPVAPRWKVATRSFALAAAGLGIMFAPLPIFRQVPGVAEYEQIQSLHPQHPGFLSDIHLVSGTPVHAGQKLIELQEPNVDLELATRELEHEIVASQVESASGGETYSDARVLIDQLAATEARVQSAQSHQRHLHLTASMPGIFYRPGDAPPLGSYVRPEDTLGVILRPASLQVRLSLPQSLIEEYRQALQATEPHRCDVVLTDEDGRHWRGRLKRIAVRGQDIVDAPQLSGTYGGPLAVVAAVGEEPPKLANGQTRFDAWVEICGEDRPFVGQVLRGRLLDSSGNLAAEVRRIVQGWVAGLTASASPTSASGS